MKEGVVLFSGGIDSTTCLFWAIRNYERVTALTFNYGQRHSLEIEMARRLTKKLDIAQEIIELDLKKIGGSALTDDRIALPEFNDSKKIKNGPPATYVPFRNGIFLSWAIGWTEARGIHEIVCGFNVIDSPDYPDTRPDFVHAMEKAINLGTKAVFNKWKFKIQTPYIRMKKSEIIKQGLLLGADYSYSISCYAGNEIPCSKCSSCLLRQSAWKEAGVEDHLLKRLQKEGKI